MAKRCLELGVFSMITCFFLAAHAGTVPPSVPGNMYLCSVRNANTGEIFYGKSIKKSYAEMYARATCQMKSHSGNCLVQAYCEFGSQASRSDE